MVKSILHRTKALSVISLAALLCACEPTPKKADWSQYPSDGHVIYGDESYGNASKAEKRRVPTYRRY